MIDAEEILAMSEAYKLPRLCSRYCANPCPIGQEYVPEVNVKDLSQIALEILASLNVMRKRQDRLIEITADGKITEDEIADSLHIQEELGKMFIANYGRNTAVMVGAYARNRHYRHGSI